jgi:hypothetical protein
VQSAPNKPYGRKLCGVGVREKTEQNKKEGGQSRFQSDH